MNELKTKLLRLNLVINNSYLNKYCELIELSRCSEIICDNVIVQKHHIVPQYYYRYNKLPVDNSAHNIVDLSLPNHIKAHYYLSKCSLSGADILANIRAFRALSRYQHRSLSEDELVAISKLAEDLETIRIKVVRLQSSLRNSGGKYIYKGDEVRHLKESELSLIEELLQEGWQLGNPKARHKNRQKRKLILKDGVQKYALLADIPYYTNEGWTVGGRTLSDVTKKKISDKSRGHRSGHKGKICVNKDGTNLYIDKEEVDMYIANGYICGPKPRNPDANRGGRVAGYHPDKPSHNKGKIAVNKDNVVKYVVDTELNNYLKEGWRRGYGQRNKH